MKKIVFLIVLISLLFASVSKAAAQNITDTQTEAVFNIKQTPQWVKDMRRFDIIAFGSFPFSMFFVTFIYDMIRWNNANGMNFSAEGRRYAPWPLKSAGAVEMTNTEFRRVILTAVGVSLTIALVDIIIVNVKRNKERRRVESLPSGSVIIDRNPYGTAPPAESPLGAGSIDNDTAESQSDTELQPETDWQQDLPVE